MIRALPVGDRRQGSATGEPSHPAIARAATPEARTAPASPHRAKAPPTSARSGSSVGNRTPTTRPVADPAAGPSNPRGTSRPAPGPRGTGPGRKGGRLRRPRREGRSSQPTITPSARAAVRWNRWAAKAIRTPWTIRARLRRAPRGGRRRPSVIGNPPSTGPAHDSPLATGPRLYGRTRARATRTHLDSVHAWSRAPVAGRPRGGDRDRNRDRRARTGLASRGSVGYAKGVRRGRPNRAAATAIEPTGTRLACRCTT